MIILKNYNFVEDKLHRKSIIKARSTWILVAIALIAVVAVAGCVGERTDAKEKIDGEMYKKTDIFRGNFSISGLPSLNQSVNLIFTVDPIEDLPNSKIKLFLPDAISLVNGSDNWIGNLKKGERTQLSTILKVTAPGEWEIRAYIESILPSGYKEYRSYYIYFATTAESGTISLTPMEPRIQPTAKKE